MTLSTPDTILESFRQSLQDASSEAALDDVRRSYTGKNSAIKQAMKELRNIPKDERASVAAGLNAAMKTMNAELDEAIKQTRKAELDARFESEWQDLSMPGLARPRGGRHPVSEVEDRCMEVLRRLGFVLVDGYEVETAYYTFDSLNIPEHHPARDMQDTFWLDEKVVLRTHTTSVQARVLQSRPELPIRIASAGRVYRNEAVDATHLAMFHQFEALWVDAGLTFAHLKGILSFIARELFGDHPIRFKPKFYPYTEPSAGVDIQCAQCSGKGCSACHDSGWITILGSGMVHPKVFEEFGYDPNKVSGIAFGLGTTRMAAQRCGVSALRSLYRPDVRLMKALHGGEQ